MDSMAFTLEDYNINRDHIDLYEYFLASIYILLLLAFSYIIKNRYYKNLSTRKYFIPAILVKIAGGITVCLVYNYYYQGGDTAAYYNEGRLLCKIILTNPITGLRILFSGEGNIPDDLKLYVQGFYFIGAQTAFLITKISAVIQIFTFQSFLITSIIFGYLSFWGIWRIFNLFVSFYPQLEKQFAFSFLFLPSVFFWGSGILKDTICLASLCVLFCSIYDFFILRRNRTRNLIYASIAAYFIIVLKIYIIMSFSVCVIILVFLNYRSRIQSATLKNFVTPIFIFFAMAIGFFILKYLGEKSQEGIYSLDKLIETAQTTRDYIYSGSSTGSRYSLGEFENSLWGLIKVFPAAVNVTLFRPYIWEAHNFIAGFASLENLFILLLTLKVLLTNGPIKVFKIIISHDLIFFCIIFSMIFAFAVGLTSSNFGTLVRYKIPCIPFYLAGIYLIQHIAKTKKIYAR